MGHKWIIDVLADLQSFAEANDLTLLADHLDQSVKVASAEIDSTNEGAPFAVHGHDRHIGSISPEPGNRKCA